jgi:hypothetical protein
VGDRGIRTALTLFGLAYIGLAIWMAAAPHTFYRALGPFDVYNPHYLRDVASFEAAIGVGLLIAVRRPSWRVPMLVVSAVQFGLHSINHLVDIDIAHPRWIGYFDFFTLLVTAAQLTLLVVVVQRQQQTATPTDEGGAR